MRTAFENLLPLGYSTSQVQTSNDHNMIERTLHLLTVGNSKTSIPKLILEKGERSRCLTARSILEEDSSVEGAVLGADSALSSSSRLSGATRLAGLSIVSGLSGGSVVSTASVVSGASIVSGAAGRSCKQGD